jgi:predicted enzyme related to lactoylglutathione lyase
MELRICIDVDDMERAVAFYTQGLGLQVGRRFKSDFVELLGAGNARHWTPVHLDFVVEDIDAAVARLLKYGAVLEMPVADRAWGRIAGLADPFGHGLDLLEFKGRGYDEILHPH